MVAARQDAHRMQPELGELSEKQYTCWDGSWGAGVGAPGGQGRSYRKKGARVSGQRRLGVRPRGSVQARQRGCEINKINGPIASAKPKESKK